MGPTEPVDAGTGPMPPVKPVAPIPSMQSGAPLAQGPRPQGQDADPLQPAVAQPQAQPQPAAQPSQPIMGDQGGEFRYQPDAFSAPYEEPPMVPHKTVEGFFGNLKDDVGTFVAGIPAAFRTAWQAGSYLTQNQGWVQELANHPEALTKELQNTGTQVVKGFTDTYKDGIGEALYKHPFSVFMDAATICDMVGGGIKAAGGALGKEGLGLEVMKFGDSVQRAPGMMLKAPFTAAGDLAMKVPLVKTLAETFALTPLGLAEKDALASQMMKGRVEAAQMMENLLEMDIPKELKDEYWQLRDGYKPLDLASQPILAERARAWQQMNKDMEQWMIQMGIKNAEELSQAALKPLAQRLFTEAGSPWAETPLLHYDANGKVLGYNQEWLNRAADWKAGNNHFGMQTEPTYHPFFAERSFDLGEMLQNAKSDANALQYQKRLEKKGGYFSGLLDTPNVVEARATLNIKDLKAVVDYITDATQRLGKPVKLGADLEPGMTLMDPLLKKYIQNGLINAHQLMTSNFIDELRGNLGGKSLFDMLKDSHGKAAQGLEKMGVFQDLKDAAANPGSWGVAIPKEVAYLIESQLKGVTGITRMYDKFINTWRNVVVRLMPRFYVNSLLGHSVLLMFGGYTPFIKSMARDEKLLPAEALSAMGIGVDAGYRSDLLGAIPGMDQLEKWAEMVSNQTATIPRQVLLNSKMMDILEREAALGDTTAKGLLAGRTTEEAVNQAYADRRSIQELGAKQFIAAKGALEGGDLDRMEAMMSGEKKPVFTQGQEQQLKTIDSKLQDLQKQLDKEGALSNASLEPNRRLTSIKGQMQELADARDRIEPLGRAEWVKEDMEHLSKLADMSSQREALAPVAAKVEEGVRQMEAFLGNYGRLHPLERQVIRRIIPFWTFQKTMGKLLLTMPVVAPKVGFLWHQYAKFMIDAANDDRLSDRFRNAIPIGHSQNPDGDVDTIFLKSDSFSPFRDMGMSSFGGIGIPKLIDPMNNPLIKMAVQSIGGYDNFTEKPFTEPTDFVTLNGAVYRFNPNTMELRQTVPQKPLLHSLFEQIPHMKVLQEALDSIDSTRGLANAMGPDITHKDPDGNYMYNRHWWWSASRAMGFPVSVSNPEKVAQQHDMLVKGMIERFQQAARRVDPDQQAKLEHILEDLGNGGWKLREWGD